MARKKKEDGPAGSGDDLAGTVEGLRRANFEREKAAYEKRTGERVTYVPGVPTTRTPIVSDEGRVTSDEFEEEAAAAEPAEGEGAE